MQEFSILVADDNPSDQVLFESVIKALNDQLITIHAYNGRQLLNILLKEGSSKELPSGRLPDVIFIDLKMPILNGLEALRFLRQHSRFDQTPIYFFSGNDSSVLKSEALALGALGFFEKPQSFSAFKELLHRILKKHGGL